MGNIESKHNTRSIEVLEKLKAHLGSTRRYIRIVEMKLEMSGCYPSSIRVSLKKGETISVVSGRDICVNGYNLHFIKCRDGHSLVVRNTREGNYARPLDDVTSIVVTIVDESQVHGKVA